MTNAIILLVIVLVTAYFYLRCSVLGSLSTLVTLIIATILTFSYYEILAGWFVSRGYGIQWAYMGCFILIFVLSFALLYALQDLLIGRAAVDLGKPIKIGAAVVGGLLSGIIICGNLFVVMGLTPVHGPFLYERFPTKGPLTLGNPNKTLLNSDGIVVGLYGLISRGSLSGRQSFAVLHADYVSQLYLNRLKTGDDILAITAKDSLVVPSGNNKKPVRIWDSAEHGELTVVRMGLVAKNIQSGGAINPDNRGQVQFIPAQIRLICKPESETGDPLSGSAQAVAPFGFYENGQLSQSKLDEVQTKKTSSSGNIIWLDVVFKMPNNCEGILLEFKQGAVARLEKPVTMTDEIENALNGQESETGT